MRIHKEGYGVLRNFLFFLLAINLFSYMFFLEEIQIRVLVLTLFCYLLVLQFFRNPKRRPVINDNHVISPADGTIVGIKKVFDDEYFNDNKIKVSIFMSPLNVHVNWYPIAGEIKYAQYHPGNYVLAFHPKSSDKNEHTSIVIANSKIELMYRQIAGYIARRIVFYPKVGTFVNQSENSGFIKFGSRLDLLLPIDAKIKVKLKQKVKGSVTTIAEV